MTNQWADGVVEAVARELYRIDYGDDADLSRDVDSEDWKTNAVRLLRAVEAAGARVVPSISPHDPDARIQDVSYCRKDGGTTRCMDAADINTPWSAPGSSGDEEALK